jgi:PAS domain S-box-containing protein
VRQQDNVNILLVDDQPAKLMTYEVILSGLGENLIKATSGRDALQLLLKTEVAVVLIDVCMPDLDGFELATLIREHPRFQKTAIIFVSAVHLTDLDYLRGYESGAVDYVSVPVVPELLRAKVKVFSELYRKTRQLERLNAELERRVAERTTELESSMRRLQESEQRRSLALVAGRMGSWEWNLETGSLVWDEGQYRIFGVDPSAFEPTQENIAALVHPEDRDSIKQVPKAPGSQGAPYNAEFRIVRPDGQVRWCVSAGTYYPDDKGTVRVSGVTSDITTRKRAEEALHQTNEELERRIEQRTIERERALSQLFEAQKMDTIGQITGGVAHDFNNLLMAVLGSLELLRKRLGDDAPMLRLVDNAIQGAERGAALTQRLLAFARRQELKPKAVDVRQLVAGMEDLLKRAVGPAIRIATDIPVDLPPVKIDANQFELVLLNLAVNARDAMPNGGALTIGAEYEGCSDESAPHERHFEGRVRISVADTGVGMDEATLARATDPFFTTKGSGKGTGLGLSMVHGITLQSGGTLKLSSRLGEGTLVELWLPRAQPEIIDRQEPHAERARHVCLRQRPCTVLVVDDDALVRTGTAAMLEDLGHCAIEASSGANALELLKTVHEIDLVLTDQAMPGMTGMELARCIRRSQPALPIILASGYSELPEGEPDDRSIPRLSKPFRQQELAAAISGVVGPFSTKRRSNALIER